MNFATLFKCVSQTTSGQFFENIIVLTNCPRLVLFLELIFIFVPLLKTTQMVKCRKAPFGKLNLIFDAGTLPCSLINLKMFNSEFTLIWSFHSLFTFKNILEMDKDTMQLIQYFSIAINSIVSALYLPLPGCPAQSHPSVHVYTYSPTVQHPCHLTFMLI